MPIATPRLSRGGLAFRLAPLVLVPALLAASTFPGQFHVPPGYWALSCAAALAFAAGWRWPIAASLVVSAVALPLFAAEAWGLSGVVPYLGAVAVADVAARSDRDEVIAAVAAWWAVTLLVGNWLDDHTSLWNAVTAVTVVAGVGVPVLLGLYLRAQKRLAALYRERAVEAELRRATAESTTRAQERAAMARELHDLVAHHMASIVLRVGVAEHVLGGVDPRVSAVLDDVHGTAGDTLADIRRLQTALRDPALGEVAMVDPDALWTQLDAAIARTCAAGFPVTARIDRTITGLDALARLTLLRVTQEALTNAMKHGLASAPVELTIGRRDRGVGVRVESAHVEQPVADGHGLVGMAERLTLVGGRLDVHGTPDTWVVDAWLPEGRES